MPRSLREENEELQRQLEASQRECEELRARVAELEAAVLRASTPGSPSYGQHMTNEAVHALAWVPSQPDCLLSGTGFKWLRMYDLRAREATLSFLAHTRAVLGVEPDPV